MDLRRREDTNGIVLLFVVDEIVVLGGCWEELLIAM